MQLTPKEIKVLQALHFLKEHSRYEIARVTGISTVSVTALLNRLIGDGKITKSGKTGSRSGRPSVLYDISVDFGYYIGVSIETNCIRLVAIDPGQRILVKRERPLALSPDPGEHLSDIIRQLAAELEDLFASGGMERGRLLALGISLPGMVDSERGVWLTGLRVSGIGHIYLRDILERNLSMPISVEDSTRCIAWRELTRQGAEVTEPFVLLYLGSGVGAGIVIDGKLYRGAGGLAGEIGHLHVTEDGDRCPCGNIGCLETVVSEPSILRNFQRRLAEGVISSLARFSHQLFLRGKYTRSA
jgi:predicted NBD/HSP70 family sugar kinase